LLSQTAAKADLYLRVRPGSDGALALGMVRHLVDKGLVDQDFVMVRRDADRVFVGKRAGYHCVPQEEINQILLREAQKGKRVVRL
ncbi:hypothetical protein MJM43_30550, partial [Salmonella enterica subsp. enterica serovar Montevideo]|nr:hypothetical protein [Salmonella enterica subsp. enterica serovar Montevideo]